MFDRPTHRNRDDALRREGAEQVMRKQQEGRFMEDQAVRLAEGAREQGMRDGMGAGRQQGMQEMAGLMQQDGQNYGSQEAQQQQAYAEELAQAILEGQVTEQDLQAMMQQAQQKGDQMMVQVIQLAMQMVQGMQERQAMEGQVAPEQPQGPAGLG